LVPFHCADPVGNDFSISWYLGPLMLSIVNVLDFEWRPNNSLNIDNEFDCISDPSHVHVDEVLNV
jgi:hypothetical protein